MSQPPKTAALIATLLKENPKPIFLLGAGASITSGIPLADEMVSRMSKWAYARQNGKDIDDPRITRSDWYPWLKETQQWFKEDVSLSELFPYAVEYLLQPKTKRKDFWIQILNPDIPISKGYLRLVELMHLQRIKLVLTTNFDDCILKARNEINRPHHIDVVKTSADLTMVSANPPYPLLVYLHGAVENYTDKNVIEEIEEMDKQLVSSLVPILKDHPIVVIGYRGAEPSIMEHLLLKNLEQAFHYKHGIYWCIRKGEKPEDATEYVKTLSKSIGTNFQFVEIESFDNLVDKEIWGYLGDRKMKLEPGKLSAKSEENENAPKNFDLQSVREYNKEDLDNTLLKMRIVRYCEKLNIKIPEKIDDAWLKVQMLGLNLLKTTGEKDYITNAGMLLFGKNPEANIPSCEIRIRFVGSSAWLKALFDDSSIDDQVLERTVTGNLWNQLNEVTEAISLVNRPFRLKNQTSDTVLPYDSLALKEVIVNSLVHRDYEVDLPNIVEIYANRIIVKNPGGLIEEVKNHFEDETIYDEIKRGKRGIKGYRNPVLADLFYSSGDMDKKGSGLYDVIARVEQAGSHVAFAANVENTSFSVELWKRADDVDEITNTSIPVNITTTKFSSNILAFQSLPQRVFFAPSLHKTRKEIFEFYANVSFPPFLLLENAIYTFTDLTIGSNPLRNTINLKQIDSLALDEFVAGDEGNKRFVWLISDYLKSIFYKRGLIIDQKRKRAYFPKTDTGERTISYQARFKKATRTVVKPKMSANKEKIRYWEHKAFYYTVTRFGEEWGVLIEPTYVFTLNGQTELLASKKVGVLATKKASRDYNLNVLNDIVFWAWVISGSIKGQFNINNSIAKLSDELILTSDYLVGMLNSIDPILDDNELRGTNIEDDSDLDEEIAELADIQREEGIDTTLDTEDNENI